MPRRQSRYPFWHRIIIFRPSASPSCWYRAVQYLPAYYLCFQRLPYYFVHRLIAWWRESNVPKFGKAKLRWEGTTENNSAFLVCCFPLHHAISPWTYSQNSTAGRLVSIAGKYALPVKRLKQPSDHFKPAVGELFWFESVPNFNLLLPIFSLRRFIGAFSGEPWEALPKSLISPIHARTVDCLINLNTRMYVQTIAIYTTCQTLYKPIYRLTWKLPCRIPLQYSEIHMPERSEELRTFLNPNCRVSFFNLIRFLSSVWLYWPVLSGSFPNMYVTGTLTQCQNLTLYIIYCIDSKPCSIYNPQAGERNRSLRSGTSSPLRAKYRGQEASIHRYLRI